MLVLSRKEDESIVFPKLGIRVQVTQISGRVVRLGVEAPKEVRVLREELVEPNQREAVSHSKQRHALRNRLNHTMLHLQLLQAHIEQGSAENLGSSLLQALQSLERLNAEVDMAFPALEPQAAAPATTEQVSSEPTKNPQPMALIVDDSANEAQLLAQLLELNGFNARIFENGKAAIEWLRKNELPDVVLMDMNMPEMDGATTIGQIRLDERLKQLCVFGVSGMNQRDTGIETGLAGVQQWFTKPLDARKLLTHLQQCG